MGWSKDGLVKRWGARNVGSIGVGVAAGLASSARALASARADLQLDPLAGFGRREESVLVGFDRWFAVFGQIVQVVTELEI